MHTVVMTPIWGRSSFAVVGREMVLGLEAAGHDVDVIPMTTGDMDEYSDWKQARVHKRAIFDGMEPENDKYDDRRQEVLDQCDVKLAHTIAPNTHDMDEQIEETRDDWNLYTVWESNRLPEEYSKPMKKFDNIITSSTFNQEVFAKDGIDAYRAPQGFERRVYNPASRDDLDHSEVEFLCIADYNSRKNLETLVQAFLQEFAGDADARLTIKTWASMAMFDVQNFQVNVNRMASKYRCNIDFINETLEEKEMRDLYQRAHAFVLPTRGEGWGRPFMEAAAVGTLPIATAWSGHMDFLEDTPALLVDYSLDEISEDASYSWYRSPQKWANVDVEDLQEKMRWVYDNPEEAERQGRKCVRHVRHYTKDYFGEQLAECLEEIYADS